MAKTLSQIITQKEEHKEYRVKFAFEPHAEMLRSLEMFLGKYDLIKMGKVHKTIFQDRPMDFEHLSAGVIWMVDIVTSRGISSGIAVQELAKALVTSEDLIRIRGKYEPAQMDAEIGEDDIELDEYTVKLDDIDYKSDSMDFDMVNVAGGLRAEQAVKDAIDCPTKAKYSEYMFASFGKQETRK